MRVARVARVGTVSTPRPARLPVLRRRAVLVRVLCVKNLMPRGHVLKVPSVHVTVRHLPPPSE